MKMTYKIHHPEGSDVDLVVLEVLEVKAAKGKETVKY